MSVAEVIRRRNLPHWDVPHAAYFITTCLEGSIPARGLLDVNNYRAELKGRPRPANRSEPDWRAELWKRAFVRVERWLDQEPAVRHLEDPRLARLVVNAFYHFAGQRYDLLAFVVMPSHYHWVIQPREAWVAQRRSDDKRTPREQIMHSVDLYTATKCNRLLGRRGAFWQHEPYDHWIRDVNELERIIHYVEANPVKAGLVSAPADWEFSSAHYRIKYGLEFGDPLLRR